SDKQVPLVGIYTLTQNTDNGVYTQVFYEERAYDEAYDGLVKAAYKNWFGKELEGNVDDAYSKLCDQPGFFDTIHSESSECNVPWVTAMYEVLKEVSAQLEGEQQSRLMEVLASVPLCTEQS
uniref:hypothetical protein n=1 Tax=Thalassospira sp. CH_XMU1420-2 TaxID=3107769 RepID=UPI00300857D1